LKNSPVYTGPIQKAPLLIEIGAFAIFIYVQNTSSDLHSNTIFYKTIFVVVKENEWQYPRFESMRTQKPSREIACEVCGKVVRARGYKAHIRLTHLLIFNTMTKVVETTTQVNLSQPLTNDLSDSIEAPQNNLIKKADDIHQLPDKASGFIMPVYTKGSVTFIDRVRYYQANPEIAKRKWDSLVVLQNKYGWVKACYFETWQALKNALGMQDISQVTG
jgi:hypothetical protein